MKEEKTRKTVTHIGPFLGQKLLKKGGIMDIFGTFSTEKIGMLKILPYYIQNYIHWYKSLKITISKHWFVL